MCVLFCLMVYHNFLKLSSLFFILFSFCISDSITSSDLFKLSYPFFCLIQLLLNPSSEFFGPVIVFFKSMIYVWYFLTFSLSLLKCLLCLCIVLLTFMSLIMRVIFNSLTGKSCNSTSLVSVTGDLLFLCLEHLYLVLHFP